MTLVLLVVTIAALVAVAAQLLRQERVTRSAAEERARDAEQQLAWLRDLRVADAGRSSDPPAPPLPQLIPDEMLVQALAAGDCALYAGSRLCSLAGVPTLENVLNALLGRAMDAAQEPASTSLFADSPSEIALEALRMRTPDPELRLQVSRRLATPRELHHHRLLEALSSLPFAGVVTDDMSGALAQLAGPPHAQRLLPWSPVDFDQILRESAPFVVEAHGSVHDAGGRILLDAEEVRATIDRHRDYERFLVSLLSTRSMLFVCASPWQITQFMRQASGSAQPRSRPHWALVPWTPNVELAAQALKRRYGLELLVYDPAREPEEVERFVEQLDDGVRRLGRRAAPSTRAAAQVPRLQRLELQNIGTFETLSIELGARRSILLGDNGVGKSTILRAIALALVGEHADRGRLAQHLLRSGASSGSVLLSFGDEEHRVDLHRERDRVRIHSPGFIPIDSGLWLALGFPPLRGVSLRDPHGPERGMTSRGPVPDDLLPIFSSEPDRRLDDLKQWIVNAEVRTQVSQRRIATRYREMLRTFFGIVGRLIPGVDFSYAGVDERSWRVLLHSRQDGELAFEQMSQGMIAILGWVGVLLQRLYEVHDEARHPALKPAIVLVDEIDAHLHPGWQRELLPLLDEFFPAIHLVATTHSPLVVTSTREDDAVIRLERATDGRMLAHAMHERFKGSTADEVLTSEAFDLRTPFDRDTDRAVREYTALLARGETPDRNARAAQLAAQLGEPRVARTPHEEHAAQLFRRWLGEQLADVDPEQRERLTGEGQRYLDRLRAGGIP